MEVYDQIGTMLNTSSGSYSVRTRGVGLRLLNKAMPKDTYISFDSGFRIPINNQRLFRINFENGFTIHYPATVSGTIIQEEVPNFKVVVYNELSEIQENLDFFDFEQFAIKASAFWSLYNLFLPNLSISMSTSTTNQIGSWKIHAGDSMLLFDTYYLTSYNDSSMLNTGDVLNLGKSVTYIAFSPETVYTIPETTFLLTIY